MQPSTHRRGLITIILALATMLTGLGTATPAAAEVLTADLVGRVTSKTTGEPIAHAWISVEVGDKFADGNHTAHAEADEDGRYRFDDLPAGRKFEVWASDPSDQYQEGIFRTSQPLVAGEQRGVDLRLYPEGTTTVITGRVTIAETGAPVPGVSVEAIWTEWGTDQESSEDETVTDSQGRYTFEHPSNIDFILSVRGPAGSPYTWGHTSNAHDEPLQRGEHRVVDIQMQRGPYVKSTSPSPVCVGTPLTIRGAQWKAGTRYSVSSIGDLYYGEEPATTFTVRQDGTFEVAVPTRADAKPGLYEWLEVTELSMNGGWDWVRVSLTAIHCGEFRAGSPTISGSAVVGSTLAAHPGDWSVGTTLRYQWYQDGTAIAGADRSTYTIPASALTKKLTVRVTGSVTGREPVTKTSASTDAVIAGTLTSATPTIAGPIAVRATVTAAPGAWTSGTSFSYQWYANGKAISKATKSTFILTKAQAGKTLSVTVIGTKPGYATVTKTSAVSAKVATAATPSVSGTATVGSKLKAKPGKWTSGTKLSYQWYSNDTAIRGATKSTYTVADVAIGGALSVTVTGTKSGYATVSLTSKLTTRVPQTATPKIVGSVTVGSLLTADPGTWTAGTTFTYRWHANGKAISKATKSTFIPTKSQAGKKLTVKVTGTKSGYTTVTKKSAATAKVRR